jgi:cytochrome bd-type quinol oxidase subunit 1
MNYPFWDVPIIGSAWMIGIIAIFHVMISHFAVGGGLYLAIAEAKALRQNRKEWLNALKGHSKFFLILTGIYGAVSGVGIWFVIGLANPEATSALIHNFVFGWAIEWVFFMIELGSAAVYYYSWDRIPSQLHLKIGWFYAIVSFFTLVIINGILTFMLTPGQAWLSVVGTGKEASQFWAAFFNPTYWPSLVLRTLVCLSLAGIWALINYSRIDGFEKPELKKELIRWSAKWLIPSFLLMPFAFAWYIMMVPESGRNLLTLGISTIGSGAFTQVTRISLVILMTSATIVGVVYFFAWRSPTDFTLGHALSVLFLALLATASAEYVRETLRKPYVISHYMYSNGVHVNQLDRLDQEGYLTHSMWTRQTGDMQLAAGQAMFRGQCMACHTLDGYRAIKDLIGDRDRQNIMNLLITLHEYKEDSPYRKFMPKLVGTDKEIQALADYLYTLNHPEGSAPAPVAAQASN